MIFLLRYWLKSPGGGTWYLGGYICSILGRADPPIHVPNSHAQTHPCTKFFCSKPILLPILFSFYCQTHPCTKNSSSKPIHVPKFHDFFRKWPTHVRTSAFQNPSMYQNFTILVENDPPMYVHFRFKTHPCTSSIRIHENMWVPPRVFVSEIQQNNIEP